MKGVTWIAIGLLAESQAAWAVASAAGLQAINWDSEKAKELKGCRAIFSRARHLGVSLVDNGCGGCSHIPATLTTAIASHAHPCSLASANRRCCSLQCCIILYHFPLPRKAVVSLLSRFGSPTRIPSAPLIPS